MWLVGDAVVGSANAPLAGRCIKERVAILGHSSRHYTSRHMLPLSCRRLPSPLPVLPTTMSAQLVECEELTAWDGRVTGGGHGDAVHEKPRQHPIGNPLWRQPNGIPLGSRSSTVSPTRPIVATRGRHTLPTGRCSPSSWNLYLSLAIPCLFTAFLFHYNTTMAALNTKPHGHQHGKKGAAALWGCSDWGYRKKEMKPRV